MKKVQQTVRIRARKRRRIRVKMTPTRAIVLCFLAVILVGALLLTLPRATRDGQGAPFLDALFTAVSATCVTGLILHDTYLYFTLFGQVVILVLIQIGGLGLMTFIALLSALLGKQLSIYQRRVLMETSLATEQNNAVGVVKSVVAGTFAVEGCGALLLSVPFVRDYGWGQGLWMGLFHAVTAFCNAGFDLLGREGAYSSLVPYATDWYVNIVVMLLIVIGGLGFPVWKDLIRHKFRLRRLELHSKLVLAVTAVLVFGGAGLFFLFEYVDPAGALHGARISDGILGALFQSVSARTAGFNTFDQGAMTSGGTLTTVVLMMIGGSPGSTAGGVKTTTVAVVLLAGLAWARNNNEITVFRRRVEDSLAGQAAAIASFYLAALVTSSLAVGFLDHLDLGQSLYVCASAVGTVGFSNFTTSTLSTPSLVILMVLMFAGRVGALSLALAFGEKRKVVPLRHPTEKIAIG